jgi:hypothetical protein
VSKDVLAFSGTVPVPTAGAPVVEDEPPDELELLDEEDVLELLAEELVPVVSVVAEPPLMDESALCTAEVSWVLTRLSAVWLAMLARPADKVVEAPNIELMTASLCA